MWNLPNNSEILPNSLKLQNICHHCRAWPMSDYTSLILWIHNLQLEDSVQFMKERQSFVPLNELFQALTLKIGRLKSIFVLLLVFVPADFVEASGNCLFSSVLIYLTGSNSFVQDLRAAAATELYLNSSIKIDSKVFKYFQMPRECSYVACFSKTNWQ